jgi:hypothetical protein
MGSVAYVSERPESLITDEGMVHLVYSSGDETYQRACLVDLYEAYLKESLRLIAEWRGRAGHHATALVGSG